MNILTALAENESEVKNQNDGRSERTVALAWLFHLVLGDMRLSPARSVFDRYNIVSEADLARATERLQAHLEEQPRVPVVVPIIIAPTKTVR